MSLAPLYDAANARHASARFLLTPCHSQDFAPGKKKVIITVTFLRYSEEAPVKRNPAEKVVVVAAAGPESSWLPVCLEQSLSLG